jgi:hypothetical protein
MKFAVRYWSSLLPKVPGEVDEHPHWIDYSLHPASKLGLNCALLAVFDRLHILKAHGGQYDCTIFVLENGGSRQLYYKKTEDMHSNKKMYSSLPKGEIQMLDIKPFLLPVKPEVPAAVPIPPATIPQSTSPPEKSPPPNVFEHTHTPYDDLDPPRHLLDIDI